MPLRSCAPWAQGSAGQYLREVRASATLLEMRPKKLVLASAWAAARHSRQYARGVAGRGRVDNAQHIMDMPPVQVRARARGAIALPRAAQRLQWPHNCCRRSLRAMQRPRHGALAAPRPSHLLPRLPGQLQRAEERGGGPPRPWRRLRAMRQMRGVPTRFIKIAGCDARCCGVVNGGGRG